MDPDHSWEGGRTELDGGRMDGFLKAASDVFSIGYYEAADLPFTPHVAQAFTAFDRFFCSLLSSTYPNREYMHAAQSYGMTDNSTPSGDGFPDSTIFAALTKAGVSNHYYYTDIPVSALWGSAGLSRSSQIQTFYEQAAAGTLPALSFVDPAFNGEDQGTSGDEHPHGDVRVGQAFVADVAGGRARRARPGHHLGGCPLDPPRVHHRARERVRRHNLRAGVARSVPGHDAALAGRLRAQLLRGGSQLQ